METLDINIAEQLDKEWTTFLDGFLWNTTMSIAESNRTFLSRRNIWMRKITKKYDVTLQQLKDRYIHDK